MNLLKSIWQFFGIYQNKTTRLLHCFIFILVITQIIISNWMQVTKAGLIPTDGYSFYFTWIHIGIGFCLLFLAAFLILVCFSNRGFRYFFPYLWGDFTQIKNDIRLLSKLKLPESSPRGLATTIQGLGLGALAIVVLSGVIWFILWLQNSALAPEARNIHKTLTGLIEAYIIGHGLMGLLHFILWKNNSSKSESH
ncbi:cytochrome b/b6 domain-containing protein [Providencia rustigianii]|uniref:cytochrome b/b6 domain-containing protein n=1 Tax=Providencia rustigianii TaxID=158850 RepID=UPI000F713038|nr:cytochrome b/b6 domain-containing protein [Providencia rustigianii]MTC59226.1 cytochrome b/b6 domain-containing protein [Providencia rustigianii]VEH55706.1 Cytochrome b(N-terminal)/b6/petB [Providencia rustigianii]